MSETLDVDPPSLRDVATHDAFAVSSDLVSLLHLTGELDLASAPTLAAALEPLIHNGSVIGIDLDGLTFMDCSGIRVLDRAVKALGERGHIVVYDPPASIRRLLELTGLDDVVDIYVDTTDA